MKKFFLVTGLFIFIGLMFFNVQNVQKATNSNTTMTFLEIEEMNALAQDQAGKRCYDPDGSCVFNCWNFLQCGTVSCCTASTAAQIINPEQCPALSECDDPQN